MARRAAWIGPLGAGAASVAVGSSVAASSLLTAYPVLPGQAVRYALGAALLAALTRRRPRLRWRHCPRLLALSATGMAGFNALLILALRHSDPALVGIAVGGVPLVLALAGPLMSRRAPPVRIVVAAAVVVGGAAAVQWAEPAGSAAGLLLALGAMLCEAMFSLLALSLLRDLGAAGVATYGAAGAVVLLTALTLVVQPSAALTVPTASELAALVYLAAVVTSFAFFMWYTSLEHIPVEVAGLFVGLVPVSALATSALVGTTAFTPVRVAGALAVGFGIVLGVAGNIEGGLIRRTAVARELPDR